MLGEEAAAAATARYVDSSVERLQVLVNGMVDPRHVVTCNGYPSSASSHRHERPICSRRALSRLAAGRAVCIRRFRFTRRWCSTLWIPGRGARSADAHIMSRIPGGRNYDTFPVNANEAESRRIARFFKSGTRPAP